MQINRSDRQTDNGITVIYAALINLYKQHFRKVFFNLWKSRHTFVKKFPKHSVSMYTFKADNHWGKLHSRMVITASQPMDRQHWHGRE